MESCVIQLTPAAHKYGNLNIRPCGKGFFPPDVFGAPSKKAGIGVSVILQVDGLPNPIETDIPTDKKSGCPRWLFRERAWVKKFVKLHNLQPGDEIVINRIASQTYVITPNGRKSPFIGFRQLPRIERQKLEDAYKSIIEVNSSLNRRLVSFQANKDIPFYNWFAYKEGFSYQMVKIFIKDYPKKRGKLLDPFAGSGTALFAANEMGFNSLGIELLPIGEFILDTRIATNKVSLKNLKESVHKLRNLDFSRLPTDNKTNYKHIPITQKAFPRQTEQKINAFMKYVEDKIEDQNIKQILKFSCFSILEKISYTRKDGQYLRWDCRSGKSRTTFSKGKISTFEQSLFSALDRILFDLETSEFFFGRQNSDDQKIDLRTTSCFELMPKLPSADYDLIITSPPYCNRYDYTRTYALELAFLGIDAEEIKKLRQSMLSCTVENKDKQDFLRKTCEANNQLQLFTRAKTAFNSNKALQEVLTILLTYKNQNKLNNSGIYRMVRNYFYEHAIVVFQMARLLKPGGKICYVNDNVRYAGETIPVDLILSEFAQRAGLQVQKIFTLQIGKGNSSQQMGQYGRDILRKSVCLWRKPN
jgi:DNA modification methylase